MLPAAVLTMASVVMSFKIITEYCSVKGVKTEENRELKKH